MPRIFLGNFDFEEALGATLPEAGRASRTTAGGVPVWAGKEGADLCWAWLAIAEPNDCILAPGPVGTADLARLEELGLPVPHFIGETAPTPIAAGGYELVPWGWTNSAVALGASRGWGCNAPPLDIIRKINSREFRFELECRWNVALADSVLAGSLPELSAAVASLGRRPRGWLLKANFGMSGREALRGRGTTLDERTRNWAQKRLVSTGPIVVEPLLERIAEAGIQIDIPQAGEPALLGITPLLVDRSGVYRGSRCGPLDGELDPWRPAADFALGVARRLRELGYFGPLGTDAMQYRDDAGQILLRPLQDLNARYSMGRMALGFRRILPAGWCGTWIHFGLRHLQGRTREELQGSVNHSLAKLGARFIPASPRRIGHREAEHHGALVLAPGSKALQQAEAVVFEALGLVITTI